MNSTLTVLPSRQHIVRRRPSGDITTFYAIELFIAVAIVNAILIALAAPLIPDVASLYVITT
jgi:hypothetical protein